MNGGTSRSGSTESRSLQVVHVVSSLESEAAGTTYAVKRIVESIADLDNAVSVVSIGSAAVGISPKVCHVICKPEYHRFALNRKLLISASMKHKLRAFCGHDLIHAHGLWRMPNVYPAGFARRHGLPLVLSPHGMLGRGALRFSAKQKFLFWHLVQGRAIREVKCFHATSEQEYNDIREFGLKQPVAIIPLGIDLPLFAPVTDEPAPPTPYILSLCRIHPKKGLANLVRAWATIANDFPSWRLKIVGPSEMGYAEDLRALINGLGLMSVAVEGPVFGDEKLAMLRKARVFVLPTIHENFGMTVAESLVCGTPVIATKGAPWGGLEANACGWWVDHGTEPLARTLRQAMELPIEKLKEMGSRGRAWMARDFSWSTAGEQMVAVYRWLKGRAEMPSCIRVN